MKSLFKTLSFIVSIVTLLNSLMSLITSGMTYVCHYSRPGDLINNYNYDSKSFSSLNGQFYNSSLMQNCDDNLRSRGPYKENLKGRALPTDLVIVESTETSIIESALLLTNYSSFDEGPLYLVLIDKDGPALFRDSSTYNNGSCIYHVSVSIYDRVCGEPDSAKVQKFFIYVFFITLVVLVDIMTIFNSPIKFYMKLFCDYIKSDFGQNFESCNPWDDNALYLKKGSKYLAFTDHDTKTFDNFAPNDCCVFRINKKVFYFQDLKCYVVEFDPKPVVVYTFKDFRKTLMFKNFLSTFSKDSKKPILNNDRTHCLGFDEVVKEIDAGKFISLLTTDKAISAYGEEINIFDITFLKKVWNQFNKRMQPRTLATLMKHNIDFFGSLDVPSLSLIISRNYHWYNRPQGKKRKQWENYTSQASSIAGWVVDHKVSPKSARIASFYKQMPMSEICDLEEIVLGDEDAGESLTKYSSQVIDSLGLTLGSLNKGNVEAATVVKEESLNEGQGEGSTNDEIEESGGPVKYIEKFLGSYLNDLKRTFKEVVITEVIEESCSDLKIEHVKLYREEVKLERKKASEDEIKRFKDDFIIKNCKGMSEEEFIEIRSNPSPYRRVKMEDAINELVNKNKVPVFNYFSCLRRLYEDDQESLAELVIPKGAKERDSLVNALKSRLGDVKKKKSGVRKEKGNEGMGKKGNVKGGDVADIISKVFGGQDNYIEYLSKHISDIPQDKLKEYLLLNYEDIVLKMFRRTVGRGGMRSKKGKKGSSSSSNNRKMLFNSCTAFQKIIEERMSANPSRIIEELIIKSIINIKSLSRKHIKSASGDFPNVGNFFLKRSSYVINNKEIVGSIVSSKLNKDGGVASSLRGSGIMTKTAKVPKNNNEKDKGSFGLSHTLEVQNYVDCFDYLEEKINLLNVFNELFFKYMHWEGVEMSKSSDFMTFIRNVSRKIMSDFNSNALT